jgi:hypothetical protein
MGLAMLCGANVWSQARTVTLESIADVDLNEKKLVQNFGAIDMFSVNRSTSGYSKEALMKFELSKVSGKIQKATLRLYAAAANPTSVEGPVNVFVNADSSWKEEEITWESKPEPGKKIATFIQSNKLKEWVEVDVTGGISTGGLLTIHLAADYDDSRWSYSTKETLIPGTAPQLVLTLE